MHIQSYQIHNVLNVYRRQLSQGKPDSQAGKVAESTVSDSVTVSSKGNNQSVMEKVAENVLKKITNINPESGSDIEALKRTKNNNDQAAIIEKENRFVFNTIADDNQKETRSIAVDNSQVLMSRLDELAKAAIARKSENNSQKTAVNTTAERTEYQKRQ